MDRLGDESTGTVCGVGKEGEIDGDECFNIGDGAVMFFSGSGSAASSLPCTVFDIVNESVRVMGVRNSVCWFSDVPMAKQNLLLRKCKVAEIPVSRFHMHWKGERVKVCLAGKEARGHGSDVWYDTTVVWICEKTGNLRVKSESDKGFVLDVPAADVSSFLRKLPENVDYLGALPLKKLLHEHGADVSAGAGNGIYHSERFRGVSKYGTEKRFGKAWMASIFYESRMHYLGDFSSEESAALRYDIELGKISCPDKKMNIEKQISDVDYADLFAAEKKAAKLKAPPKRKLQDEEIDNVRGKRVKLIHSGETGTLRYRLNGLYGLKLDSGKNVFQKRESFSLL